MILHSYVGWRPAHINTTEWVQMRSGAGEGGWWHRHLGEADFGGNPVDGRHCRTCGAELPASAGGDSNG